MRAANVPQRIEYHTPADEWSGRSNPSAPQAHVLAVLMLASLPFAVNLGTERACEVPSAVAVLDVWLCSETTTADVSTDPAALLVALVGFVSVVVLRSGEHAYTANRVRPLRHAAFLSAFVPLGGAWLLAFQGPGSALTVGWAVLTAIAWLAYILLQTARWRLAR